MLVNEIFTIFFTILKATTYFYSLTFRFLFLRQGPQATNYATIPMIIYKIMLMDILCDFFFFFLKFVWMIPRKDANIRAWSKVRK